MASSEPPGTDMDFDVLARIRRLEAQVEELRHRIAESERRHRQYRDAPEYKRTHEITEHECLGAMLHVMSKRDTENG